MADAPVYCWECENKNGAQVKTVMVNKSPSNFGYFKCAYGHITRRKIEDYEINEKSSTEGEKRVDND